VALIAGIVMGGGVGVSIHGSHRVGLDEIGFAMPEVGIGFFPDVGATHFLPRMPPGVGMWLALTGTRLATADALALGLLTHAAPKARKDEIIAALASGEHPDAALQRFRTDVGQAPIRARLKSIARLFAGSSVEAIVAGLEREATDGRDADIAAKARDSIRQKSPTSLKIAFEQLRRGRTLDFRGAMRTEFRIASRIVRSHDLYEGIRAVVVDKDNKPEWRPASLAEVTAAEVEAYFAPPD
jgi:enoyl-CoA hydratase